jgi:hypothetical protein
VGTAEIASGTHTEGTSSYTLTDSSASWTPGELYGYVIENITDDSQGLITDNTANTASVSWPYLKWGSDNQWEYGDEYRIIQRGALGGYGFSHVVKYNTEEWPPDSSPAPDPDRMVTSVGANASNSIGAIFRVRITSTNNMCNFQSCHGGAGKPQSAATYDPLGSVGDTEAEWYRTPIVSGCNMCHTHGTDDVHATHDDSIGKGIDLECANCHDTSEHMSGTAKFNDGNPLSTTNACDPCHSEGGAYDGVAMAKANWADGIYESGGEALKAGKEQWCVSCHDAGTSVCDGVSAPNVALYYTSGHGRNGMVDCLDCHDATFAHIDGEARTYAFDDSTIPSPQYYSEFSVPPVPPEDQLSGVAYASGYRLGYVDGKVPLMIPAQFNIAFDGNREVLKGNAFRLCFSCHDSLKLFDVTNEDGLDTNFKYSAPDPPRQYTARTYSSDKNQHVRHMVTEIERDWDSDWNTGTTQDGGTPGDDSMIGCSTCHNVHGAAPTEAGWTNEPMIRDGSLVGRGGYGFSYLVEDTIAGGYPWVTSEGATQSSSVGAIFRYSTNSMCGGPGCHPSPKPHSSSYNAGDATIYEGTHTGSASASTLTVSGTPWTDVDLIWMKLENITDGSEGYITGNTSNTATVTSLTGGTNNEWNTGDTARISVAASGATTYLEWYRGTVTTGCNQCHTHGTDDSHTTHDDSSVKGIDLECADCHDISEHMSGNVKFTDANTLSTTNTCDPCHSEGGVYDGVAMAKANWADGVYMAGGEALEAGKEQWCVSCHDGGTSVCDGVSAPNVDLYYTSGHGRSGAGVECLVCHDATFTHVDGESRTYAYVSEDVDPADGIPDMYDPANSGVAYASGYRLRYVGGEVPVMIPAEFGVTLFSFDDLTNKGFRRCFSCHDSSKILDDSSGDGLDTNFKITDPDPPRYYSLGATMTDKNGHLNHLWFHAISANRWDSDWDLTTVGISGGGCAAGADSAMTCSSCHNVHGAASTEVGWTNEPMIRDGRLAGSGEGSIGTHTGDTSPHTLTDSNASWTPGELIDNMVENTTDGSIAKIIDNTANTVVGNLGGGSDNQWENGDTYRIWRRSDGYGFSYVVEDAGAGGYPWVTSEGATQANSVGAIFRSPQSNMCGIGCCHGVVGETESSYDATGNTMTPPTHMEWYRPWQDYSLNTYTISGSVGTLDGVTMSGLPGDPVTTGGGSYSADVDSGWSGTVTPTKTGYTFDPVNRVYSNVTSNQPDQDYTPMISYTVRFGDNSGDDFPGTIEDALMWERDPEFLYNYGTKVTNPVGERGTLGRDRRSVIRFKNIAASLGAGKVITSAKMYLYCTVEDSGTDHGVSAYRVLLDWVEGTADGSVQTGSVCWDYARYTSLPWNSGGCSVASDVTGEDGTADRRATPESTTPITSTGQYFSWDLTTAVQNWYSGAWSEYGVVLINDDADTTPQCRKVFNSSDNSTNGTRPYLEVTYEAAAP